MAKDDLHLQSHGPPIYELHPKLFDKAPSQSAHSWDFLQFMGVNQLLGTILFTRKNEFLQQPHYTKAEWHVLRIQHDLTR